MKYESVQQAREALTQLEQPQAAYNHALGVLYLDATTAAPRFRSRITAAQNTQENTIR